jgi:hypothetical protein
MLNCNKITTSDIKPEINPKILNEKGIVGYNANYKKNYFRLLPYFFYNGNGTFNEILGDSYNVDYLIDYDINIMPGFWSEYGEYKNVLLVLISKANSKNLQLKNIPISVKSSKHGMFEAGDLTKSGFNENQQGVLFIKKLELQNKYDILNKIYDDVITVTIGGQIYKFLNPEIDLN